MLSLVELSARALVANGVMPDDLRSTDIVDHVSAAYKSSTRPYTDLIESAETPGQKLYATVPLGAATNSGDVIERIVQRHDDRHCEEQITDATGSLQVNGSKRGKNATEYDYKRGELS